MKIVFIIKLHYSKDNYRLFVITVHLAKNDS